MTENDKAHEIMRAVAHGDLAFETGVEEMVKLGLDPGEAAEMLSEEMGARDIVKAGSQEEIDRRTSE